MNPWPHIGRYERTVRRLHDWQRLLGSSFPAWSSLLQRIEEPTGLRFAADFGAGEQDFELARDEDGFVAIPLDGVTLHRLNPTEAEFARLDLLGVLRQLRDAAGGAGTVESLLGGVYQLGVCTLAGRGIALLVAPMGVARLPRRARVELMARRTGIHAKLVLVPDLAAVCPYDIDEFAAANVAVSELGGRPPLRVDWSPLADDDRFGIPLVDPVFFYGARFAVIVDLSQQRIWLEGNELKVMADKQAYRLFAHLAERPQEAVPVKPLANQVLEASGDRPETKIVSDAKRELMQAISAALSAGPAASRIDAATLIHFEGGRVMLNVDPSLVKIRRLSER